MQENPGLEQSSYKTEKLWEILNSQEQFSFYTSWIYCENREVYTVIT